MIERFWCIRAVPTALAGLVRAPACAAALPVAAADAGLALLSDAATAGLPFDLALPPPMLRS